MKYILLTVMLVLLGLTGQGQNINDYKYVIVPAAFEFSKGNDQYQLNSLAKFLFEKYGFDAYLASDKLPGDYKNNICSALNANLVKDSGFLRTKLYLELKDCDGNVIFVSDVGSSKEKDFKVSYHEAMREAFLSLEALEYAYNGLADNKKETGGPTKDFNIGRQVMIDDSLANAYERNRREKTVNSEKTNQNNTTNAEDDNVVTTVAHPKVLVGAEASEEAVSYKSASSPYNLKTSASGFDVYDGNQLIGTARAVSNGTYLVKTTAFDGVGYIDGDTFVVERAIKGVDELVKMIFIKVL